MNTPEANMSGIVPFCNSFISGSDVMRSIPYTTRRKLYDFCGTLMGVIAKSFTVATAIPNESRPLMISCDIVNPVC